MKKILYFILASTLYLFASCSDETSSNADILPTTNAEKTVFMYLPWTGDSQNLYSYFIRNIKDVESAIVDENGLGSKNLMIFISQSATKGSLIKVKYQNGACVQDTISKYENTEANNLKLNTSHWIKYILNQVKSYAPADTFSMIVGCHGMGWIRAADYSTASLSKNMRCLTDDDLDYLPTRDTRWFGGIAVMTDISTLAEGLSSSGIGKLQYLLFDDCYLSNIETAYYLKDYANYIIACPTEILAVGMPYSKLWKYLSSNTPDYQSICDEFYKFYSTYDSPYGTLGITNCAEIDSMATIMKDINTKYTFDTKLRDSLQVLDGYNPPIFYDFGDYVRHLCTDNTLLTKFEAQLTRMVPYKTHTDKYYSNLENHGTHPITTYSGITISDPSTNSISTAGWQSTTWYTATH